MTTPQQAPVPELSIRNQHLAVFTAIYLEQEPVPHVRNGRVEFVFRTQISINQLEVLYKTSALHQALELNFSLGRLKHNLLKSQQD